MMEMTRFEQWLLRRIVRKVVVQGEHAARLKALYGMIAKAVMREFPEDSRPTLVMFLEDRQMEALESVWPTDEGKL